MTTNNATNTGQPITVGQGGTGNASFTAYDILAAGTTSTGSLQGISPSTSGFVLTSNGTSALPTFQATSGGSTTLTGAVTGTGTGTIATTYAGTVPVTTGGTGVTSATAYAPIFGGTTSTGAFQSGSVGTSGQVLTSNGAGAIATFKTLQNSNTWVDQTTTSVTMTTNTGYVADNASLVTFTLPTTASIGDSFEIVGKGAGLWTIAQNSGQTIHFNNQATTAGTGGSISSVTQYDCIMLRCITANTTFAVTNSMGANFTVV